MRPGEKTLLALMARLMGELSDPATTELVINRPGEMMVERNGVFTTVKDPSLTYDYCYQVAVLAASMSNQDVGPAQPGCASSLPGGYRIQVCLPPIVPTGTVSLTIRKRATDFVPTLPWLQDKGYFKSLDPSVDWVAFFEDAVRRKSTIMAVGETGSGKTTFAEALIRAIPLSERLVTIEDTAEWDALPHQNRVSLFYSKGSQGSTTVGAVDLLEYALRMRPDRILMQELRDGAAFTFLRVLAAGHAGGISTAHALTAPKGIDALALMVRQSEAGKTIEDSDVRAMLSSYIDIIVHCDRDPFRLTEVFMVKKLKLKDAA